MAITTPSERFHISIGNIIETEAKIDATNTHIHGHSLSWPRTGASIKSGGLYYLYGPKFHLLVIDINWTPVISSSPYNGPVSTRVLVASLPVSTRVFVAPLVLLHLQFWRQYEISCYNLEEGQQFGLSSFYFILNTFSKCIQ